MKPQLLHSAAPSLRETRAGRHLLVWGDLAQWLVVDDELDTFLKRFDGTQPIEKILHEHAASGGKPIEVVAKETAPIIDELCRRGILSDKTGPTPLPPEAVSIANVTINLTNRCNLKCQWCYNAEHRTEEIPIETIMGAIRDGSGILSKDATFIILGGEPFLYPDRLVSAIEMAGEIFQARAMVSTNGTLVTPETINALVQHKTEVQVSIDSHDPAVHDAIRGPGVFDKACGSVKNLVDAGIHTILSMVFTDQTESDFERYLDLAAELGAAEARFIPMRLIGHGKGHSAQKPDLAQTFRHLLNLLERRPDLRQYLRRDYFTILFSVCRFSTPRTGCGIGRKVIFIDADGTIYPCPNHVAAEMACGNVRDADLGTIVKTSSVMNQTRDCYQVCKYSRCSTCTFRYWCAGDCRGEVLAFTGDPSAPSPHCGELRDIMTEIFWLISANDQRLGMAPELPDGKAAVDSYAV